MKLLTSKNFTQKIIIALVIVILFNFISPQISFGSIGGVLFEPIKDLTLTVADGAVWILQKIIFGLDTSILKLKYDKSWTATAAAIGAGILSGIGIVVGLVAAPFTAGLSLGIVAIGVAGGTAVGYGVGKLVSSAMPQNFHLPLYAISPAEIFSNQIALLDVNFFNPNSYNTVNTPAGTSKVQVSSASQLQAVISQWYFTIRNFSIVALLSILIYTGIKIIMSSSAQDKAKYKQRLLDWIVAMCLLFFLNYIMSFAVTITELITKSLVGVNQQYIQIIGDDESLKYYRWDFQLTDNTQTDPDKQTVDIDTYVLDDGTTMFTQLHDSGFILDGKIENDGSTSSDGYTLIWPTNLMGKARIEAQLEVDGEDGDNTLIRQFGYTIIFLGLVIYTVLFLFRYLKRLLLLAFLTIIAPFVAMTYPLDKMNDGNAQAFNMWLKEYVFNLLIQPVHLILYTVLVGSAISFVSDNLLYALAAFGFILQAEKIMRKFFGFEKASTLAGGSALGGALAMQGINMLRKVTGPKKKKDEEKGKSGKSTEETSSKVRFADRKADKGKDWKKKLKGNSNGENGSLPNPNNPFDKTSKEGNRIKDAKALHEAGFIDDDSWKSVRESDTRGIGQWIYDSYQGSKLQTGIHNTGSKIANSKAGHFTRKVGAGLGSAGRNIHDFGSRAAKSVPKPIRNTIRGATSVVGKGIGKGLNYVAPKAINMAGNAIMKAPIAGAAAMGGIAAGLVSEDFRNVATWGATAAGAGWIAGGGIEGFVDSAGHVVEDTARDIPSTYTIAAHGYEAEEIRQQKAADKAAMKDKDRRDMYAKKLALKNKKEIEQAMQDAQKYREAGVTDDSVIISAMKAKAFSSDRTSEERIITAGLAQEVKKESGTRDEKMKVAKDRMKKARN